MNDLLPIYVFSAITVVCIIIVVILKIREKHSLLNVEDNDFIEDFIEKKKRKLNSNLGTMSFKTYTTMLIGLPLAVMLGGWLLLDNKAVAMLLAIGSVFVPDFIIKSSERKQKDLFEERYARGLKALSSCLRANMSIQQAVSEVSENIYVHESIRDGFQQINADIRVGLTVQEAFQRFADHSKSQDAQDVAKAIAMQNDVGGSEARVIENVANNIQNRIMMRKEIKSLFAETNVMVTFMDFIPFVVVLILYIGAPQLINPYFESVSMVLVLIGLLSFTLLGSVFIRRKLNNAKRGGK